MKNGAQQLPLAVVGCDFRVASSRVRSQLVLEPAEVAQMAAELRRNNAADGFFCLNTCNRNEWIVSSDQPGWAVELLRSRMKQRAGHEAASWLNPYCHIADDAARHIFRVAIGQESLVVGERQIAGQLQLALKSARNLATSTRLLNGLGSVAGRLVRTALRRGFLESHSVGVHSLALGFVEQQRPGDQRLKLAVIGIGQIGRRVCDLMEHHPRFEQVCCNRTVATDQQGRVRPLSELSAILADVDAAIVCTGSNQPTVRPEHLAPRPAERPLLLVDIGIPEQVVRADLAANIEVVGLDRLVQFQQEQQSADQRQDPAELDEIVQRAIVELRLFESDKTFSEILETVQKHNGQVVHEEIPRVIAERLHYLPDDARTRLEEDLRAIILDYTGEVFRTIKETSRRQAEGQP